MQPMSLRGLHSRLVARACACAVPPDHHRRSPARRVRARSRAAANGAAPRARSRRAVGRRARAVAPGGRVLRARPRSQPERSHHVARAGIRCDLPRRRPRALARERRSASSLDAANALGDARAAEDRPHRLPVAGPAVRRCFGRDVLRRRRRRCSRSRRRTRRFRSTCRTSSTRTTASAARSTRSSIGTRAETRRCGARRHRACGGYRHAGAIAAGGGPARGVAGPRSWLADDAGVDEAWDARLRRAVCMVSRGRGERHGWDPVALRS